MITYFKKKNYKSKKKHKVYFAQTSGFITLSLTGVGLLIVPKSTGRKDGITIINNVKYEIFMQKYEKIYKKKY